MQNKSTSDDTENRGAPKNNRANQTFVPGTPEHEHARLMDAVRYINSLKQGNYFRYLYTLVKFDLIRELFWKMNIEVKLAVIINFFKKNAEKASKLKQQLLEVLAQHENSKKQHHKKMMHEMELTLIEQTLKEDKVKIIDHLTEYLNCSPAEQAIHRDFRIKQMALCEEAIKETLGLKDDILSSFKKIDPKNAGVLKNAFKALEEAEINAAKIQTVNEDGSIDYAALFARSQILENAYNKYSEVAQEIYKKYQAHSDELLAQHCTKGLDQISRYQESMKALVTKRDADLNQVAKDIEPIRVLLKQDIANHMDKSIALLNTCDQNKLTMEQKASFNTVCNQLVRLQKELSQANTNEELKNVTKAFIVETSRLNEVSKPSLSIKDFERLLIHINENTQTLKEALIDKNEKKLPSEQFKVRLQAEARTEVTSSGEINPIVSDSESKKMLPKETQKILAKAQEQITFLINEGELNTEKATALQILYNHVERNINNPIDQDKLEQIIKLTKEIGPKIVELKKLANLLTSVLSPTKAICSSDLQPSSPRI